MGAASPRAAAEKACEIQRAPQSTATVFDVSVMGEDAPVRVDLADRQCDMEGAQQ